MGNFAGYIPDKSTNPLQSLVPENRGISDLIVAGSDAEKESSPGIRNPLKGKRSMRRCASVLREK
jgi:hypothetical protein